MTHTAGDCEESMSLLKELDDEHGLTTPEYTLEDFRKELEEKRYIKIDQNNETGLTEKSEQLIRKKALEHIFGKLKKGGKGDHKTKSIGQGGEASADRRPYQFGDTLEQIAFTESFKNAQINNGIDNFQMTERDLEVTENF